MKKYTATLTHFKLAKLIAYDTNLTHKKALQITTSIIGIIGYNIIKYKKIKLQQIGTLKVIKLKPKITNDYQTQKLRLTKPKNKIKFKPSPIITNNIVKPK